VRPLIALILLFASALAQAATWQVLVVGQRDDPRYERKRLEQAYPGHAAGRIGAAVQVALEESQVSLAGSGHQLKVQHLDWDANGKTTLFDEVNKRAPQYLVLDLPAAALSAIVSQLDRLSIKPVVFNVSEPSDAFRGAACHAQLLHTLPSQRMLADAVAQWLVSRNWREVLWLTGTRPGDVALRDVWQASLKRYGVKVKAQRNFVLSGDPRQRDQSNTRLLTSEPSHDAVLVLDTDGEFARSLPYNTAQPRPVLGHAGLVPLAWHPRWDRYGAPQLNRRFIKQAGREMAGQDWAAWVAMKAIATVLEDKPKATLMQQLQALRSGAVAVDGFKGGTVSFRPWDGQLRQPVFLAHGDGVAAAAPVDGAMHPKDVLDTLGADEGDSLCRQR
jgi:ABC transporter substrate binding protein (PQQ-dependent alcohol dehydrogenase system)